VQNAVGGLKDTLRGKWSHTHQIAAEWAILNRTLFDGPSTYGTGWPSSKQFCADRGRYDDGVVP
jgi:hypothetical protein